MKTLDKIHVRQLKNACLYATWSPVGVNLRTLVFLEKKTAFGQEKMKITHFLSTLRYGKLYFSMPLFLIVTIQTKNCKCFQMIKSLFCIKIYIPECSLDQFSGTRGPLKNEATNSRTIGQRNIFFHGRHIFSSVLRHLVTNFFLDKAEEIVLVGSGNNINSSSGSKD